MDETVTKPAPRATAEDTPKTASGSEINRQPQETDGFQLVIDALKLNGIEMTNALAKRYEDDVDASLAAAELGLTKEEFAKNLTDADKKFKSLLRRLEQAAVPRDQFETVFLELAPDITDMVVVKGLREGEVVALENPIEAARRAKKL